MLVQIDLYIDFRFPYFTYRFFFLVLSDLTMSSFVFPVPGYHVIASSEGGLCEISFLYHFLPVVQINNQSHDYIFTTTNYGNSIMKTLFSRNSFSKLILHF